MTFAFDLISDLHQETWPTFNWKEQATSPFCVVAGDIGEDRQQVVETLRHLGSCYQAVFYIDGNDEHAAHREHLGASYLDLSQAIESIPNVVYLQDNVVVVDGVAIVGTNGWWGFDLDLTVDPENSAEWYREKEHLSYNAIKQITKMSNTDATYMAQSIRRLQTHNDVKKIVCVTHTVPDSALIEHDIHLDGTHRFNMMGNRYMKLALDQDSENKIHTWCFGHYHGKVDQIRNGVRFVNNCRGRGGSEWSRHVYYPERIVIDF